MPPPAYEHKNQKNKQNKIMTKLNYDVNPSEIKVLVVDDIPLNVLLIEKMLSPFKFNILKANSGEKAMEKIENDKPDIILLDLMMPGMNGYDVIEAVRATTTKEELPIIILSALNSNDDVVKGFSLGANDFLTKPIIMEQLHNSVIKQLNELLAHRGL